MIDTKLCQETNEEETNKNYSKNIVKESVIDKAM